MWINIWSSTYANSGLCVVALANSRQLHCKEVVADAVEADLGQQAMPRDLGAAPRLRNPNLLPDRPTRAS